MGKVMSPIHPHLKVSRDLVGQAGRRSSITLVAQAAEVLFALSLPERTLVHWGGIACGSVAIIASASARIRIRRARNTLGLASAIEQRARYDRQYPLPDIPDDVSRGTEQNA